MIIAGACLYTEYSERNNILECAKILGQHNILYRCKLWGGGTTPEKYILGMGEDGIELLEEINNKYAFCGTEIQTEYQYQKIHDKISFFWIGARNSQNYGLISILCQDRKNLFIKRSAGMTINELIGIYDICEKIYHKKIFVIERGINTFDRLHDSRWSPDLKGVIRIKNERKDIFDRLYVDCSHSVGRKEYIEDVYIAFKSIGIQNFMFECTLDGKSKTDQNHMITCDELLKILEK